jgi:DNA-binding transcriptional LysR family regulator
MDIRHLRYFLAVAEAGHMTRAAERLGIQQPPLSLQIKGLEKELGVALFHRHPKGVALSDAGRLFEMEARRLVDDMAAMEQRMARVARGELGVLNVGFTSSAGLASPCRFARTTRPASPMRWRPGACIAA